MIEVRFHGRGGQGAQIACKILATAAFVEGKDVQAFPYFGVERRGAPVTAFTKIDDRPIRVRSQIYEPDYVVVLDESLLGAVDVTDGLKPSSLVLVNTQKAPAELEKALRFRVATVDATSIAMEHKLGSKASPIVNTAIMGGFARATGIVKMESIKAGIEEFVPRFTDQNVAAAREAFEQTRGGMA